MKVLCGFLIGILVLLVVLPVQAFAGDIPGPAPDGTDQWISAISPAPASTLAPRSLVKNPQQKVLVTTVPPPAGGTLYAGSVPAGASVYVDGALEGTTPLTVSPITPGVHAVSFTMAGYADYTPKVTVTAGAVSRLVGTLKPVPPPAGGTLYAGSVPAGASVYVDGALKGTTPLTVSPITPGVHAVSFTMAGYADYTTKVTVTAGAVTRLVGTLKPVTPGTVTRTASPSVPGTIQVPITRRTTIPSGTTIPVTVIRPPQQVTRTPSAPCTRYYSGSGEIAAASDGRLNCTTFISTDDRISTLVIQEGTLVTDAAKRPVGEIRITPVTAGEIPSGAGPDGSRWTGRAYHFLPDHASFDPPVLVSFTLSQDEWDRSDPANLTIWETGETGQGWEPLVATIDPVTRTLSAPARHFSIIGLFSARPAAGPPVPQLSPVDVIRTATGSNKGPLPLSPVLPDEYAPLAAAGAGVTLSIAGAMAGGSTAVSSWWNRILDLIKKFLGSETSGLLNATEIEKRSIRPSENLSAVLLGLSSREMMVMGVSALGFAAAILLQNRLELELTTVIIFVCAGGIATILHDLAHKYGAYSLGCITEYQFWSLGTVTMLSTAWLFGNAFAKPSRTLIRSERVLSPKEAAVIKLAGPLMSMGVAVVSLVMIPLGGLFVIAGSAGFTINLLNSVFSLVPVKPNDGVEVYAWNKLIWAFVFIPLMAFYLCVYVLW